MTISLEEQKLNLALSLIINSGEISDKPDKIKIIESDINKSLKNSKATTDKFSIVWGPAIFHINEKHHDKKYDHVVMIVKNIDNPIDYRLVIRGTWSKINEIDEDLHVSKTVDWSNWDKNIPQEFKGAKISHGTNLALNSIINDHPINDKKELLVDVIDKITTEEGKDKILNITVTGHSLGGLLASTIGLYLKRRYINNNNIRIHACSFAGPTAGNDIFASYSDSFFKGTVSPNSYESHFLRIHNINDIVPLAWAKNDLKKIEKIYPILTIGVKIYIHKTHHINYTQLSPEFSFSEQLNKHQNLLDSIGFQHINAYPKHYQMSYKEIHSNSTIPTGCDIVVVDSNLSKHIHGCFSSLIKD
ncbi:lipase family protein [Photorhabdus laumondii]|uniref:Esterase n=1 Tax=Photorhabdus laumondii subsp. clarkei TaxID=2029685 RepID=A0A329VJ76_9GAMM|nr:lipase family protein [Photorhabdus laumondii]RAW92256.1 esterase [Photorhabdus laumondii subsp. clarkei]